MPALFYGYLRRRSAWACLLFFCTAATAATAATPSCGDFLDRVSRKPAHLQFVACKETRSAQVAVLEATYRVEGRHAAAVERYFMRYAHMQALRFVCCGWEALPNRKRARWGALRSSHEFDYEIQMHSGETLISNRRDWPRIESFTVTVILPLEQP